MKTRYNEEEKRILRVIEQARRGRTMQRKALHGRDRLQHKVGSLIRKATFSTGELMIPRELLGIAFSNVGKVRRDVLDVLFQEVGRYVENFADNYTIKIRAELNFERKKDKPKKNQS